MTTPPSSVTPGSARLQLGFSAGELVGMSRPDVDTTLNRYKAAGGNVIRFDIDWSGVQPDGPASYDWVSTDAIISALASRGLTPLPILDYTPAWARPPGCSSYQCGPADPAQFAAFAATVVRRYASQGVTTWEVWNEENTGWLPSPSVSAYGRLLQLTSAAIHGVQPNATVLVGGLAPAQTVDGMYSPQDFVSGLYGIGLGSAFDGVAVHPYCFPALPGEGQQWSGWTQMLAVHNVMTAHGDTAKGVWATEFGAPTNGPGAIATFLNRQYNSNPDHVDEDFQARTVDAAVSAARQLPWLRMLLWYGVRDLGTDPTQNGLWFGLQRADGSNKAAYARWQAAVSSLGG